MKLKNIDPEKEFSEVTEELYHYVVNRDDGLCQVCGCRADHVHHIKFKSQLGKNKANNLVCLCREHHIDLVHADSGNKELEIFLLERVAKNEARYRSRI